MRSASCSVFGHFVKWNVPLREITAILIHTIVSNARWNAQVILDEQQGSFRPYSWTNMVGNRLDLHRLGSELRGLSGHDRTLAGTDTLHGYRRCHKSIASLLHILSTNTQSLVSANLRNDKTNEITIFACSPVA